MLLRSQTITFCNTSEQNATQIAILQALWPAYNLVFPFVLITGIAGNMMNLLVLTRPTLRGVTYVYLTGLAVADLGVMVGAVPAVLRFNLHHSLSYFQAFYHAYIELFVTHSFMTASVFIVCFMTLDRFFSVCRPSEFKNFHTRKNATLAISFSYIFGFIMCSPLAALKTPCTMDFAGSNHSQPTLYAFQENRAITNTTAWRIYIWVWEPGMRLVPALTLAILNCLIITSFRNLARHQRKVRTGLSKFRRRLDTTERKCAVHYRMYLEEQRLVHLLTAIIITFFLTMTPATVLSLIYTDHRDYDLGFQVFRATANILEISNFALNFFIYCLCSKQFRDALKSLFNPAKVDKEDGIEITTRNGTSVSR